MKFQKNLAFPLDLFTIILNFIISRLDHHIKDSKGSITRKQQKKKIRQKHKGRTFSKETLLKMSKSAKVGGIGHKKRGETDISQYISLTILVVLLMGTLWSIFLLWNRYLVGTYMKTSVFIISMKIEVTIEKKIYNL